MDLSILSDWALALNLNVNVVHGLKAVAIPSVLFRVYLRLNKKILCPFPFQKINSPN